VLGVQLDRFDHQVECMDTIDFACHTVGPIGCEVKAFGEIKQAIYALGIAVEHDEHRAGMVFRPREQEQMIGAEVKHGQADRRSGSWGPARLGNAVVGLAGGRLRRVIITARRMSGAGLLGRRIGIFVGFAQAIASEQKDFGVLNEPVSDGGGDGRIKEDIAPVGERSVGRNHSRPLVTVTGRDHLIKEVRGLLVEGEIAQLIADEEGRLGVGFELSNQRVIDLRGE
jgi:hypothetical protein